MKRNVVEKTGRQIVNWLSKPWNKIRWLSARIGADHGYRIYAAEQTQRSPVGAPHSDKPMSGQLTALNTWEDEGGKTAVPAKTIG